jgi:hypothetical protein
MRSAFGPKADMPNEHVECPLMTQSGHWGGVDLAVGPRLSKPSENRAMVRRIDPSDAVTDRFAVNPVVLAATD